MAGDWIKWTKGLTTRIEVLRISGLVRLRPDEVAGKLMRLWEWCDDNIPSDAEDGNGTAVIEMSPADGDNMAFIDSLVGGDGFATAMVAVRWIEFSGGNIRLPNFFRHNGETAKTRARNARNQKKKRGIGDNKTQHKAIDDVTEMSPQMSPRDGDILVTREEKRREEKSSNKRESAQTSTARFQKPTLSEVGEYCIDRNNRISPAAFIDYYDSVGWKINGKPMKDWKAAIRTWERRDDGRSTPQPATATSAAKRREDANNAAFAGFLNAHGIRPDDGDALCDEADGGFHRSTDARLVRSPRALPGLGAEQSGGAAQSARDTVP